MRWSLLFVMLLVAGSAAAAPTGKGITIAVLDTGVDGTHPELTDRVERISYSQPGPVLPVPLPVPDPTAARPDPDGQGTAVASLVAGATLGAAPEARILDLQVSGKYTGTALDPATEQAAIQALDDLLQRPGGNGSAAARIVLLSFASRGVSEEGGLTLAEQARGLFDAGVLVIAPHGPPSALHLHPAVFVVGDSGATCDAPTLSTANPLKPDLSAPATELPAATPATPGQLGGRGSITGTAGAAAVVAGVAAQAWETRADLPVAALAGILRGTARDVASPGPDGCTGWGALDADAVLTAVAAWRDPVEIPATRPATAAGLWPLAVLAGCALAMRRRPA